MTRYDDLRDATSARVEEFVSATVDPSIVRTITTDLLTVIDAYAEEAGRQSTIWAADECHREARWRLERGDGVGMETASKLEGLFRSVASMGKEAGREEAEKHYRTDARINGESSDES